MRPTTRGRDRPRPAVPSSTVDVSRPWLAGSRDPVAATGALGVRNLARALRNPGDVAEARDRSGVFAVESTGTGLTCPRLHPETENRRTRPASPQQPRWLSNVTC